VFNEVRAVHRFTVRYIHVQCSELCSVCSSAAVSFAIYAAGLPICGSACTVMSAFSVHAAVFHIAAVSCNKQVQHCCCRALHKIWSWSAVDQHLKCTPSYFCVQHSRSCLPQCSIVPLEAGAIVTSDLTPFCYRRVLHTICSWPVDQHAQLSLHS
jgi:hypothetical protein